MIGDEKSAPDTPRRLKDFPGYRPADGSVPYAPRPGHPFELGVMDFGSYDLVIDARTPQEYAEDHIPGAMNLPVVDQPEYAQVGTLHKTDRFRAYMLGVGYAALNIADHMQRTVSQLPLTAKSRILVYCFRGGKRSRLWADLLKTVGFEVDVLTGGWRNYRRWVRESLNVVPRMLDYRVLVGPTGCGKTRLLAALLEQGAQVVNLEELAVHRGSLIGAVPGRSQPTQKYFDSLVFDRLRRLDMERPVWIEGESKKIGLVQIPDVLLDAMRAATTVHIEAPMPERVKLWREDYPHFVSDPLGMVGRLEGIKPLVGGQTMEQWRQLAQDGAVDALFEGVMRAHYDPCYARSLARNYGTPQQPHYTVQLRSLDPAYLLTVAEDLEEHGADMNKLGDTGASRQEMTGNESGDASERL